MKIPTHFYRKLTLICYLMLLIWVPIWHLLLANPTGRSPQFEVFLSIAWTLPLLLPFVGIIKGRPYTHAWANFIVMFYLIHGFTSIYAVADEWVYALIEIILSTGMFIGCSFYARKRGKELGLGIPKLKDEMAQEKATFESQSKN